MNSAKPFFKALKTLDVSLELSAYLQLGVTLQYESPKVTNVGQLMRKHPILCLTDEVNISNLLAAGITLH